MNLDAVYNRPFLNLGKLPVAIGGYVEANSNYSGTDGVNEGLSFQIPRLTLFISSTIKKRLKFLSEIEFEEGGKEIAIEFASMDIEFDPLFNLRGGIIMNPIGAFNQNHDGPKWEFINRPLSATTIIPSTWSNVGFGVFGKYAMKNIVWAYEMYATNGFDQNIIDNPEGRTWLPATKSNAERFTESGNGVPLFTLKTAIKHRKIGELGISWMGGVYNKFEIDGLKIDSQRRIDLIALDMNCTIPYLKTNITAECVRAIVDVPDTYSQQFGNILQGGFVDVVQPIIKQSILGWKKSTINVVLRAEYVDYNKGTFKETNGNIGDHVYALVPGVSFRPSNLTVIRFNYRREWRTDLLGNPPSNFAAFQFGFSTYF
ncbi:MAG: hypothetical protein IPM51_09445 [Sphingobacteriaceae bacterium]|nr:hypothetical protein [Sphingobacteriaceae bacterium]